MRDELVRQLAKLARFGAKFGFLAKFGENFLIVLTKLRRRRIDARPAMREGEGGKRQPTRPQGPRRPHGGE